MSASRDDDTERARLRESLPWLVNGTLDESSARALRELVGSDLPTRRDWLETRALAAFVAAEDTLAADTARNVERTQARAARPREPRIAAVAAAVLLLPLGALVAYALLRAPPAAYSTLSAAPIERSADTTRVRVRLQLPAAVPAAEIAAFVRPFGGALAPGPQAPGLYTIALPVDREAAARQALERRYAPLHLARTAH